MNEQPSLTPIPCVRKTDVDPTTPTGAWRVVTRTGYGNRRYDKPWWWPMVFHGFKATIAGIGWLIGALFLTYLTKKLGISIVTP